ncbi:Ig-like domain-containing protein [Sporosarcina psychrophila]|uniref:SLH domain-containing protein n=1 Tax=Sporosarcina psychrophila TaxID=1476 RepID=A0ABV2K446_SPOPS
MNKKVLKVIVLMLIFTIIFPTTNFSAAGDAVPPKLNSLVISPEELNIGETLEITADVTDDLSGVQEVRMQFQNATNFIDRTMFFDLQYDEESKLWKAKYTIKDSDVGGKWEIESIHLGDFATNYNYIYKKDFPDKEMPSYVINNPNILDVIRPTFVKGEINSNKLEAGQEFILKIKASDDSGIKIVSASYRMPNGNSHIGLNFEFNEDSSFWIGKYMIPPNAPSGNWSLSGITIEDNNKNYTIVEPKNLPNPKEFDFEVINPDGDSTPPQMESIEVTPRVVKVGDNVIIKARITDDVSGVGDVHVSLFPRSNNSERFIFLYDWDNDGIFEGSYKIKNFDEEGQWDLDGIIVYDKAHNVKQYFPSDFENHDKLNVTVTNNSSNEENNQTSLALKKFEIISNVLNVGDELIVDMNVTDNVKGIQIGYSIKKDGKESSITVQPKYDNKNQRWIGKYTVKSNDREGIWILDDIVLFGNNEEVKIIRPTDLPDSQEANFTIKNPEPLVIKSVDISKKEIKVGEIATIKVRTQGESSRISEFGVNYQSPFYEVIGGNKYISLAYNNKLDVWVGEFKVESDDVNGIWSFDALNITENSNSYFTLNKEDIIGSGNLDININSSNVIDLKKTAKISQIETISNRENIGIRFFAEKEILDALVNLSKGHVLLANKAGETIQAKIDVSKRYGSQGELTFKIPVGTKEGKWEFKEIVLFKDEVMYRIDHFINFYQFDDFISYKFYVPSIEADKWVRTNLASRLQKNDNIPFYGDHLHLIANSSTSINNFIERFKEALPPRVGKVDYHKLLNYAYRGFAEWDDPFLYQWWKEGLINASKEPTIPVQVYGSDNTYSNKSTKGIEIYFTEVLHYLPNIHNAENKVTAYIKDPNGVEFPINNFVYDYNFQRAVINYELEGGWISNFKFPKTAISGNWTIDRVEVQNGDEIKTYSNGVDFFNTIIKVTDGVEIAEPEDDSSKEVTPPIEVNPPKDNTNENNNSIDKTAPKKPVINGLTDNDDEIIGVAEAGSIITVKSADIILYTVTVNSNGKFVIPITKLSSDTVLMITATDGSGNISEVVRVVVKDGTAPIKPEANSVSDIDTKLTGAAEAKSVVTVKVDNKVIGTSLIGGDGKFSVDIPQQEAGTKLRITATDKAGNNSQESFIIVGNVLVKFDDVGITYQEEISYLIKRGVIKGYPGNYFKPQSSTKRLQAVLMILREKGITDFTAPNPEFSDIKKGDYGYDEVAKAVELGIISGKVNEKTGKKYFDPNGTLTRGHMSKIMTNAYSIKGNQAIDFTDVKADDWYYPYISILVTNKIMIGDEDSSFKPNQSVSRQHFAVILARYLNPKFKR